MKLFYHEIGRSVEFKYCFDLRLDETQPEKPSIGAKSTSESDQCLLTLDYAVITQYNYTAITLDFVLQVFIRSDVCVDASRQMFSDRFSLQLMGTRSHLGNNLQFSSFFVSNLADDPFSNQMCPTHRFQRDPRLLPHAQDFNSAHWNLGIRIGCRMTRLISQSH